MSIDRRHADAAVATAGRDEIINPPLASWPASQWLSGHAGLDDLRRRARRRLLEQCRAFTSRLSQLARQAAVPEPCQNLLDGDPDSTAIVMTGHQPVIFHPGLCIKYQIAESFAARHNLIAIAVVIDTDQATAGEFFYPASETNSEPAAGGFPVARLVRASFADATPSSPRPMLASAASMNAVGSDIHGALIDCGLDEAAREFVKARAWYSRLTPGSVADANLVTRRAADIGQRFLEVPLTDICAMPEVREFWTDILQRPIDFARALNELLDCYRTEIGIKNAANPFPNLRVDEMSCELPFWLVDPISGERRIARADADGRFDTPSDDVLLPRGALVSATLRLLFSDVFVHGLGGGEYDQFTDRMLAHFWNVTPPPFTVVSGSRWLFPAARARLLQLNELEARSRDLQFNPQRAFGSGLLSAECENTLQALLDQKAALLGTMQSLRDSGQSAKNAARELQTLTNTIKITVSAALEPQLKQLTSVSEATRAALTSRTWPWFYFPWP